MNGYFINDYLAIATHTDAMRRMHEHRHMTAHGMEAVVEETTTVKRVRHGEWRRQIEESEYAALLREEQRPEKLSDIQPPHLGLSSLEFAKMQERFDSQQAPYDTASQTETPVYDLVEGQDGAYYGVSHTPHPYNVHRPI